MGLIREIFASVFTIIGDRLSQRPVVLPEQPCNFEGVHLNLMSLEEVSALLQSRGVKLPGVDGPIDAEVETLGEALLEGASNLDELEAGYDQVGPFILVKDENRQHHYAVTLDLGYVDAGTATEVLRMLEGDSEDE